MNCPVLLSSNQLNDLMSQLDFISEGEYGVVGRVPWQGGQAILKVMKNNVEVDFKRELYILDRLRGEAGGAPSLLAVCDNPPSFVMSSRGQMTLRDAIQHHQPDWYLIYIVLRLGVRLRELHRRGVVHGDIHGRNIMVTPGNSMSPSPSDRDLPDVFLIDFGMSSLSPEALSKVDTATYEMLDRGMTVTIDLIYFETVLQSLLSRVNIKTRTMKELLSVPWLREYGPSYLEDVLKNLRSVLTEDLKMTFHNSPDRFLMSPILACAESTTESWGSMVLKGLRKLRYALCKY